MAFSNVQARPVRSKPSKTNVRTLGASYPNGRGAHQPSGKIRVRNSHPLKSRAVARPNS